MTIEERPALLKPPAIVKGDAIGVVAPSYSPRAGWLQRGVKALERAGYVPYLALEQGDEYPEFDRRVRLFSDPALDVIPAGRVRGVAFLRLATRPSR